MDTIVVTVLGMQTSDRESQFQNIPSGITVQPWANVTFVIELHPLNISDPQVLTDAGMVTFVYDRQLKNASVATLVTVLGICAVILVPLKALLPIDNNPSGRLMYVKFKHSKKACLRISVTPDGMVTLVRAEQRIKVRAEIEVIP